MSLKANRIIRPSLGFVNLTDRNRDNFWKKVNKNGPLPDQEKEFYRGLKLCWSWMGCQIEDGYGRMALRVEDGRRLLLAHRISWMMHHGPIPNDRKVLHKCDNGNCVNPDHLFLGTEEENCNDKEAKGRANHPCGEKHHFFGKRVPYEKWADDHPFRKNPELMKWKEDHKFRINPSLIPKGEGNPMSKLTERQVLEIRSRYIPREVTQKFLAEEYGVTQALIMRIVKRMIWKHLP